MNLSVNFINFIDSLGVVQGLLFGTMLLLIHYQKNKPTLFLGLFIILFSLEPIPNILEEAGLLVKHPKLELFPVGFHFLAYPLFYIYIQKISILKNKAISYLTVIPGIMEIVVMLVIFFLPVTTKLQIKASSFSTFYFVFGLVYTIYICYLILKRIRIHQVEVAAQYSTLHHKTLHWSKWFVFASIVFHILLLQNYFIDNKAFYIFTSILNVILIYWVSFKGITQQNVTALVWLERNNKSKHPSDVHIPFVETEKESLDITSKPHQILLSAQEAKEILETVDEYIKNSECFINEKLTIIDVAEATNIHPKRISHSINSDQKVNFNHYINAHRVAYAKKLLKSDTTKHLSIEGIGLESGFHSKTTFYSAFRRIEGMTPAQYKSS